MKKRRGKWLWVVLLVLFITLWQGEPPKTTAQLPPHLAYGINVRLVEHLDPLVAPLGFNWIKLWDEYVHPDEFPTDPLPYHVEYLFSCQGYIFGDLEAWREHVEELVTTLGERVDAYEVCNEPNLGWMWEGQPPDPARYVEMLCVAYEQIKEHDPEATVVSGGLAPTGRIQGTCKGQSGEVWNGNNCKAMDERIYLSEMLEHGAGSCMDAFGFHPYGFAYPPETDPNDVENGFSFRAAEVMQENLEAHGLGHVPVWATEFNWIRDPSEDGRFFCHSQPDYEGLFGWMDVREDQQADYLVRAFRYADENWPWMQGMFVWNLDWHNYNWPCEPSRYFSIRRDNGTDLGAPTMVYDALVTMEKRPGPFAPRLVVQPLELTWLVDVDEGRVVTGFVNVLNSGYRTLTWTATVDSEGEVVPTLPVTIGVQGERMEVMVDTSWLVTGTHTGWITVTAAPSDTLDSPQRVELRVLVVPEVWPLYLPAVLRRS